MDGSEGRGVQQWWAEVKLREIVCTLLFSRDTSRAKWRFVRKNKMWVDLWCKMMRAWVKHLAEGGDKWPCFSRGKWCDDALIWWEYAGQIKNDAWVTKLGETEIFLQGIGLLPALTVLLLFKWSRLAEKLSFQSIWSLAAAGSAPSF